MANLGEPLVTVLLPVYNGEKYLRTAINSILHQTFQDFELLIILDPSTDTSAEIIKSYDDPRIRLVQNPQKAGLITALNQGIDLARGEFIARMDSDDISLPTRLAKQLAFMKKHRDVIMCGTWAFAFQELQAGQKVKYLFNNKHLQKLLPKYTGTLRPPTSWDSTKCSLLFSNPIIHPSIMFRKSLLNQFNLRYEAGWKYVEDYEMWTRLMDQGKICNLGEYLLYFRAHAGSVSKIFEDEQRQNHDRVLETLFEKLNLTPTTEEINTHNAVGREEIQPNEVLIGQGEKWLLKLLTANRTANYFPEPSFTRFALKIWAKLCGLYKTNKWWAWNVFWRSPLDPLKNLSTQDKLVYFLRFFSSI
jgi:glycosyltransferase involved in cell wall biosynthesis